MKKFLVIAGASILTLGAYSLMRTKDSAFDCFNYLEAQDYQKAIASGQQAVNLNPSSFRAHFCLGRAYYQTGQLDLALYSFKKAAMYAKDTQHLAPIYNLLGSIYSRKGDLDNALLYFANSLKLYIKLGDKKNKSANYNNIAEILMEKGEFDKALRYFEKSLSLSSEKDKAPTYNNIALVYDYKKEYAKAMSYYKKALEIYTRYANHQARGTVMLNLGNTYTNIKDFKNAYHYLKEGLKIVKKVGDKYWEAYGYKYLGLYFYFQNNGYENLAKDALTKAYTIFQSIGAQLQAQDTLYVLEMLK